MQAWVLLFLLGSTATAGRLTVRRLRPSFRRDAVEKIADYPFSRPQSSARLEESRTSLMEYVFGRTLPLREAVESLPVPLLSSEERSYASSERLPLRDAVEMRPTPVEWDEGRSVDAADIIVEDLFRSHGSYRSQVNYDPYWQFDPSRYELVQSPYVNSYVNQLWTPNGATGLDHDTVEILPSRWDYQRALMKRKRKKGRKPMKNTERKHIRDHTSSSSVVCYLEGWANYRQDPVKFNNMNLDPYACTHIIYAFAAIDATRFFVHPQDEEHDLIQGGYKSVVGLKRRNPDLKVLISVGGWADDDPKFTAMTSSANRRKRFIRSVTKFLEKYQFDGIDLDWQYPGAEDMGGSRTDKNNLTYLLEELSEIFRVRGWLLSIAVPPSRFRVDDGYDVSQIVPYLDLINLLAFDFHMEREQVADHHSPLFRRDSDRGLDVFFNADYAVQYWIKRGAPRSKIILGIPFFGRSFTLKDPRKWDMGAEVKGAGMEGRYTQEGGFLAYFEVCEKLKSGEWLRGMDSVGSPYIVHEDQWVGYDDIYSAKNKAAYIRKQQLGGAGLYAVDLDDFSGVCGEKWPLLKAVKMGLALKNPIPLKSVTSMQPDHSLIGNNVPTAGSIVLRPHDEECSGSGFFADPSDCRAYHRCQWGRKTSYICPGRLHFDKKTELCNLPERARCEPRPVQFQPQLKSNFKKDEYKIVCYYTNWSGYRKGEGKFVPENLNPSLCTHVVYAYAMLDPNDLLVKPFDPMADNLNDYYGRLVKVAAGKAKALLGIGGWTDSTGDKYSRLARDATARKVFAADTVRFLKKHNFDGLHIDWNYPKCWQSNCNLGPDADKPNFAALIQDLRTEFDQQTPPLILATGISGYREVIDVAYDIPSLSKNVDFMSVMTYDYHGAWEKRTGHVSPLYYRDGDSFPRFNSNYTMEYLASLGAPRKQLVMGIPFYGQTFTLEDDRDNGYGAKAAGPGVSGDLTRQPGMLAYYEICYNVRQRNWIVSRDAQGATGPYAFQSDQWVSYDDIESVRVKTRHIRNLGFGGVMAWTADLDDFKNTCCRGAFPLLRAIGQVLGHLNELESDREDCTKPAPPATPPPPVTTTGSDAGGGESTTPTPPSHVHPTTPTPSPTWTPPPSTTPTSTTRQTWWTTQSTTTSTWPGWTSSSTQRPTSTESTTASSPWWEPPTTTTTTTSTQKPWWEAPSTTSTTQKPWWEPPTTSTTQQPSTTTSSTTQKPWWELSTTTSTTQNPWWEPSTSSTTTTTTQRPTTSTENPDDENNIPSKPCEPGRYYPDPSNCNAYYRCLRGVYQKQFCVGGLHWNAEMNLCDWPESAKCDKQDIHVPDMTFPPSTTTTTTTRPETPWTQWTPSTQQPTQSPTTQSPSTNPPMSTMSPSPDEPCTNGEYYPVDGACDSFAVCVNGRRIVQRCANGLYWNQQQKICDWSRNVMCGGVLKGHIEYNSNEIKQEIEARPCTAGSFAPYPGDCNKYLSCMWGWYNVFTCAPGLHWNNNKQICDWPSDAECKDLEAPSGGSSDEQKPTRPPIAGTTPAPTPSTTRVPPVVVPPPSTSLSGYYKIVCYFTNWAWYRQGEGKYVPEDIDHNLCTHIVYGFAVLDYENLIVKPHDSWADVDNKFYERVVAYKKKGQKISLAIGGWNDSQGDKYSRLVNNPAARARFIKHVIEFLLKHNFDGLDLDWEYPKCWQVDCKKGPDSDKPAFAAWVRELHEAFQPHGLLLSSAVSPSRTVIDAGYDVPALGQYLDWVAVMTYDFHGQWDKKTGHVAPLYYHPDDDYDFFNANYSVNYWINQGLPRRKLIMGMPLYGQSFQLANAAQNGLNANAPGPGQAGEFTRAGGFLAYYEICDRVQNRGWTVVKDQEKRMGPYAYQGNQWVSYDDVDTIRQKSEYIRNMDLGGGMIWALDLDDFRNRCGGGRHPLLSTIRNVLGPAPGPGDRPPVTTPAPSTTNRPSGDNNPRPTSTTKRPMQPTERPMDPTQSTTTALDLTSTPRVEQTTRWAPASEFKVVCYFTNWAWYRQGIGKYVPGDIDPDLCTHIIYGFAVLNGDEGIIKPHDTWADFDNGFYKKVTDFKSRGVKVLVAIGGWNDSAGDKYSRLVNNPAARAKFIAHVLAFIEKHNFDGLDLDWEYPKCWQVNCKMGPDSDKAAFAAFVRELRAAFAPKGLLLSAAVSPSKMVIDNGYDVASLSQDLDWISVMTYDYHGQWDKITGHVAPMYQHPDDIDVTFNANFSINYWINQGADRRKIVMGMPMYGQSFSLADNSDHGLNAPTYGGGEAGDQTRARGFLAYYEICQYIREKNWKVVRDKKNRMGPYAYLRDQWVSFDDQKMIQYKSEFVKAMGLGGGMIWALDLDDFRDKCNCETYPLLKTINRVLRNYPGPQPDCILDGSSAENGISRRPDPTKPSKSDPLPSENHPLPSENHPCDGRMFADHASDCNKYYQCEHGVLHMMACPPGLHWNKDRCDWPENSQCHPTEDNEVTGGLPGLDFTSTAAPTTALVPTTEITIGTSTSTVSPLPPSDYKVVCYFTNWAWYRQNLGKYTPDNIDYELCTHIAYGFAVLDGNSLTIKPHDSWADIDNDFYNKVTAFKKKGIKVLIAIGGWNDSLGDKYSRLVADMNSRRRFIETVIQFIEKYDFDGLDLDWEYPKCWQVNCNQGPDADKANFATFVREISEAFKPKGLLLSSAVSPSKLVIDLGYDVPILSQYFDYISVMTYDFHGHWDKATGHVAPLYYYPGDTYDYFNANFSLNYWIEKGADPKKIIMGMPLYGQSFTLADPSRHGLNAAAPAQGEAGEFTRAAGFLAFYEICEKVKRQQWTVVRDPEGRMGPYAFHGNQWVSYDDVEDIRRKSRLVKQLGLGGGMVWALDLDDFRNRCGCGTHPLLRTLNQELRGIGGKFNDCT